MEPALPTDALNATLLVRDTMGERCRRVPLDTPPEESRSDLVPLSRRAGVSTVPLCHPVTLIGSREGCRVRLQSSKVSPVHCAIVHTGREIIVRDLASKTCTCVNDWEVDSRALTPDDRITIHRWEFTIELPTAGEPGDCLEDAPEPGAMLLNDADGHTLLERSAPIVLVGRHARCDLTLDDRRASRAHALFVRIGSEWAVADLLSANGTRVNGETVETCRTVRVGDVIRIGSTELTFALGDGGSSPADPADRQPPIVLDGDAEDDPGAAAAPTGADTNSDTALSTDEDNHDETTGRQTLAGRETTGARESDLDPRERRIREQLVKIEVAERKSRQREADLDAREARLKQQADELTGERRRLDEARKDITERQASLERGEQDLARRVAGAGQAIELCKQRSAELDARQHRIASRESDLDRDLQAVRHQAQELEQQSESLKKERIACQHVVRSLAEREARVKEAEAALAAREHAQRESQDALAGKQAEFAKRAESLAADEEELDRRRAALDAEHQRLRKADEELSRRAACLDDRAEALEQEKVQLESEKADVARQAAQLQTRMEQLRSALEIANARERAVSGCKAELDRLVADATRQRETLANDRRTLEQREQVLAEREAKVTAREKRLAERETEHRESAALVCELASTVDLLQGQLSGGNRGFRDRLDSRLNELAPPPSPNPDLPAPTSADGVQPERHCMPPSILSARD